MDAPENRRWYYPTPGWLVLGSLAVTGILFLSEQGRWFSFNEHKGWTVLIAVAGVGVVLAVVLAWFVVALLFRWPFQFSIRSLLVLTLAVALPSSWMAVEMKKAERQMRAARRIVSMGGQISSDWELYQDGASIPNAKPPGPNWLRNLLGEYFFSGIVHVTLRAGPVAESDLKYIEALAQLRMMQFYHNPITDDRLKYFTGLSELETLYLNYTMVTDAGLGQLRRLPKLRVLVIGNTRITDAGLAMLGNLRQLELLDIRCTQVTDAGLVHLEGLKQLKTLCLGENKISGEGLKSLEKLMQLQHLELDRDPITDVALPHLSRLHQLCFLQLYGTRVSDLGLKHLASLHGLNFLNVVDTQVTENGVKKLQQTLPECRIESQFPIDTGKL